MGLSSTIPPPPRGIVLDDDGQIPPPPRGIALDADTAMPVTMSQRRPSWSGTMPQPRPGPLDALTAAHRGGTVQAYTEEPTTGPLNPLVGAVTAAKGAKEVMTSGAVPPPAAHGPAAALPTDEQRRQAMKGTSDILSGTMSATAPFVLPGAMETPAAALRTGIGIAAGTATGEAAGYGAEKAGLSPEAQELAKTAGFFIPSAVGVGMGRAYEATPNGPKDVFHSLVHNYSGQVLPEEPTLEQANAAYRAAMNNLHPDVNASHIEDAKNLNQAWSLYKQTLAPTPPPPMPRQPGEPPLGLPGEAPPMHSITSEEIAEIGDKIAKLPVEERPQATMAAHTALATELLNQGKLTIDGELHQVKNQNQADKLAQKLINEEIGRQDAQAKKAASEPVPAPPPGITLDEAPKAGESKAEEAPAFQKGDRVTLPKGDTGTVAHINSRLIRVTLDSGGKASVPVENWSKVQKVQAPSAPPAEAAIEETAKADVAKGQIIFARHGETKLDKEGANETVAGWTNEPLDERGKAAASKLADEIKEQKPTVIVTSDLARAKQTAEIVGQKLGIPVEEDARLRPQHVPETEGLKVGEATPIWNSYEQNPDQKPEGGESWSEAEKRQDEALKDVEAKVAAGERPMVVTHSRNLEMELGQKPEPGGFITKGGKTEGGAVEPAKAGVESPNGNNGRDRGVNAEDVRGVIRAGTDATQTNVTPAVSGAVPHPEPRGTSGVSTGSIGKPAGAGNSGKAGEPEPVAKTAVSEAPKYKFGNTQANIPAGSEASKALDAARARISDADLAGKGKDQGDGGNHVTVRYGIKGEDTAGIKKFLSEQKPFEATLGKTEKFPVSEHSEGAAPIIAPIEAPELHRLNAELEKHGEFSEPSFKEYKPHATIAYVDPAKADRYVGMDVTHGKKFTVDEVAITDKQGEQEVVKLEGKKAESRRESWRSPRVAPDIEKWQAPPELGVTHAPDYGQMVRADTERRMGGPLTRSSAEVAPGKVGEMKVSDLKVAPHKFQYKLSTDAEGVGTLLKEIKVFNPDLAGVISVWRDPADGKTYVVNGHHRYELAKRLGVKTVTVRHIVASSAKNARAIGALQNIAEGRGTAVDAAKFFHDSNTTPEELAEKGISLGEKTASDGFAMSRLDSNILAKVINGDLRQGLAVTIGEGTADHTQQAAILKQIERMERKGQKVSDNRVREFIRLANQTEKRIEETASLFGTEQVERSLLWEKSAVSEYIQEQIKKDKKLFGFVSKGDRATELERGGNKIDVEKSKDISTGAAQAEEVYNLLSSRGGPIADILDEAARKLADGENAVNVKQDAYARIRADISKTLGGGQGRSAERHAGAPATEPDSGTALFSPETELAPPFYSKAARIAFDKLPNSGSGQSFLATLRNAGVKEDEIKWIGLDDFLKDKPKATKSEVLSYIMRNMVQVREVSKGAPPDMEKLDAEIRRLSRWPEDSGSARNDADQERLNELNREWDRRNSRNGPTKYESYTLAGAKKNYTELLLTLPTDTTGGAAMRESGQRFQQAERMRGSFLGAGLPVPGDVELKFQDAQREMQKLRDKQGASTFKSSHFDEPNILAHVRFDERTDADGKPILFVEEVQSDWHQKGKKLGYDQRNLPAERIEIEKRLKELTDKYPNDGWVKEKNALHLEGMRGPIVTNQWRYTMPNGKSAEITYHPGRDKYILNADHGNVMNAHFATLEEAKHRAAQAGINPPSQGAPPEVVDEIDQARDALAEIHRLELNPHLRGVPNAPFKSDWHELAMKTMLRKAAEGGYDKIGWVTGEQTADRYDLSKRIDGVQYDAGIQMLTAIRDDAVVLARRVKPDEIADYIGKEPAERLLNATPVNGQHQLKNADLRIAATWATNLYDRAIPNFLSKYGKKWGAKVGTTRLSLTDMPASEYEKYPEGHPYVEKNRPAIHTLDVTPDMRASVLSEGQPLFSPASDSIPPAMAKGVRFEVKPTKEGLPSYLRLNPSAAEAINRVLGVRINGVNLDSRMVPEIVTKLKAEADRLGGSAQAKLRELANAMLDHADSEFGLSLIREGKDEAQELATLHEELLHAAGRKAGKGDLIAGTPWKQAFEDEGIVKMAAERIIPGLVQNGLRPRPEVVVSEAMVDLLRGDAVSDLTPEQIEKSAANYFAAMAAHAGIESVEAVQAVQDYIAALKDEKGISYGEATERARDAGQRGLERAIKGVRSGGNAGGRGKEIARGGGGVQEKPRRGSPEGSSGASLANATGRTRESWRSPRPAETTPTNLHSTQPIGLTDEELANWSKAKGFRVEEAGEQLGMFGGNDPVMRVFRSGRGGKEQKALVYQSQLDQLRESEKAGPTEPFTLTGGEARDEQPTLFGAGDLGEIIGSGAKGGIQLPAKEKPEKGESLFSSESGEARPGELAKTVAEAAGTVGNYLREVSHSTKIARDLQRGLQTLDTQAQADILRGKDTFEKLQKEGLTKADNAAIYHHLEDPEDSPLDKKQDGFLDDVALPIDEQNTELYKELKDGGVPIENYVHRSVKGKGGMLDRIMEGAKAPAKKGTLSKSAPQTKHRTMMAIESPSGERRVVSIKDGKATMWQDGNAIDLGDIKNAKGRSKVENETFPNGEPNSIFYDQGKIVEGPDGYDWKVTQATTKEIEAATPVRYYHSAFASLIASNIQLSRAVRAMRFLEDFKGSDEFQEIAYKGANPPKDWKTTSLPQFPNYYFEPRTAEVLDDYAERLKGGDFGILQTAQKFLRAAYLINPIVHPLNVAASAAFEKGLTGFAPWKWKTIYKTGNKAIKAVLTKNADFKAALDAGGALQSHREALQDIHKLFFDRLAEGLDKKESWAMQVAQSLGIEHGNLLNLLHKPSSIAAWVSSDVLYLQAAYQYQAEHAGVPLKDALEEVGRIIPEYRVPTRILDSRLIQKGMTNPLISWFGAYHYGLLKSFAEAAKSALGAQEPAPGRSKAEEVGKGWDRLALLGLIVFGLYPFVFDKEAKKITGDEHARVRRPGPFGYVQAAEDVAEHKQSPGVAAQKVVTPSPITKAAAELAFNREFFSGHEIYDPNANWHTQTDEIGRYLLGEFGQYGQYQRAATTEQKHKFMWRQAGVEFAKSRAEKVASDIAASKVGTEPETTEDQRNRAQRREILDQMRQGNYKPFNEARDKRELTHKQILSLEHRAKLSPLEDMVHNFTLSETQRVLDAAKVDKDQKEIELLEKILRQKRARAHAWQTPVAVGQ